MEENVKFTAKGQIMKNQPVTDLKLGGRAKNILMRARIFTVNELVEMWDKLGSVKGSGAGSVREIHAAFFSWYMDQVDNTPDWPAFINSIARV